MFKHINENYIPTQINGINLDKKGIIVNITGPDAFTKAVNNFITNSGKTLHRCVNYNKFANLNYQLNYRKMYAINNKKHYSEVNEPIFI
jgi:hypothetical protein